MKRTNFLAREEQKGNGVLRDSAQIYPIYTLSRALKGFFATHLPVHFVLKSSIKRTDQEAVEFAPKHFAAFVKEVIDLSDAESITLTVSCDKSNLYLDLSPSNGCYTECDLSKIEGKFKEITSLQKVGSIRVTIPFTDAMDAVIHAVSTGYIISEIEHHFLEICDNR